MIKRVFLIVLDSFGVGELPDAKNFGDEGSNTLLSCYNSGNLRIPNMANLGLYNIDGLPIKPHDCVKGCYGKLAEKSLGKDTTTGHWEISGVVLEKPFPTFPNGFPDVIIEKLKKAFGVDNVLCNKPYSGTQVIKDYGEEHLKTGYPIVYTSADSVLQIACHDSVYSVDELYKMCEKAREIMQGNYAVGRIIARPFTTTENGFERTTQRHDYSLLPPTFTLLDSLKAGGYDVISVGKIFDIFGGRGITKPITAKNNEQSMQGVNIAKDISFNGLCFANFVDFDMLYGHRNDVKGYTSALNIFDVFLGNFIKDLTDSDILFITGDHGCDPATLSTDHSREYIPILCYGKQLKQGVNLGVRKSFSDIGATIAEIFGVKTANGTSFLSEIIR